MIAFDYRVRRGRGGVVMSARHRLPNRRFYKSFALNGLAQARCSAPLLAEIVRQ
jgi:hypothetical protein